MKVLCECGRFMAVVKNGVTVEELMDDGAPYKLWSADRYECPNCGVTIITGFGMGALAEHYQKDYAERREFISKGKTVYEGR